MTASSRRPLFVAALIAGAVLTVAVVVAVALVAVSWLNSPRGAARTDLGTNLTERDIPRVEQLRLLNAHSPLPVPESAEDVRLRYQRFQDWFFEGTFTLPPADFDAFVRGLQPSATPGVYTGRQIGAYSGSVEVDATTRRVTVRHFST